jgi:hydroxylamine reductase (hybrid-cluster protein)
MEAAKTASCRVSFLIGGGAMVVQWEQGYFTDLAKLPTPTHSVTLGCAENRVIHSENCTTPNSPTDFRVLDMGRYNDSYSAVVVLRRAHKALNCSINVAAQSRHLHLKDKGGCRHS